MHARVDTDTHRHTLNTQHTTHNRNPACNRTCNRQTQHATTSLAHTFLSLRCFCCVALSTVGRASITTVAPTESHTHTLTHDKRKNNVRIARQNGISPNIFETVLPHLLRVGNPQFHWKAATPASAIFVLFRRVSAVVRAAECRERTPRGRLCCGTMSQ